MLNNLYKWPINFYLGYHLELLNIYTFHIFQSFVVIFLFDVQIFPSLVSEIFFVLASVFFWHDPQSDKFLAFKYDKIDSLDLTYLTYIMPQTWSQTLNQGTVIPFTGV